MSSPIQKFASRLPVAFRDYQNACIEAVDSGLAKNNSVLVQIPTGGGKTIIFNAFSLFNIALGKKVLILVHREELLWQTLDKFEMLGGDKDSAGLIKQGRLDVGRDFTVGMIQTAHRQLSKIDADAFDVVIIDEAHHIMASTWREVSEKFKSAGKKILGVTATPFRFDGKDLREVFDELVFKLDITDLVRLGYLVPIKGLMVYVDADYKELKTKTNKKTGEKDYTERSINEILNKPDVNAQIVQKWNELGENKKTIFFTVSIEHGNALKAEFAKAGITAEAVSSKISKDERNELIEKFKLGDINILINVDILTEGFDDPSVECIAIVRPTKSLSLYAQIVGRGLRPSPATRKTECLILDYTGRNRDMSIVGLGELFDLPEEFKEHINKEGVSIGSVETDKDEEIDGEIKKKRELKLLIGGDTKAFDFDSKEAMEYATKINNNHYVLSCGRNGKTLSLKKEDSKWGIFLNGERIKKNLTDGYAWMIFTTVWKYYKDETAEEFAKRAKAEPITPKQSEMLARAKGAGLIKDIPDNRVAASNLISYFLNDKASFTVRQVLFNNIDGVNYTPGDYFSPYRYEYKGKKIDIAYALLISWGLKINAPAWVSALRKGIASLTVENLRRLDTSELKNSADKKVIEKLMAGWLKDAATGKDIRLCDSGLQDFIARIKREKNKI